MKEYFFICSDFSRNVVKEYVFNDPSFPDELVQDVDGDPMFQETGMQVPISQRNHRVLTYFYLLIVLPTISTFDLLERSGQDQKVVSKIRLEFGAV